MQLKEIKYKLVTQFLLLLAIGLIVGYGLHHIGLSLFVSCFIMLAIHYRQLIKFVRWLVQNKRVSLPESNGVWGVIFDDLNQKLKKQRTKQKILTDTIHQFRDGAQALSDGAVLISDDFMILWANTKAFDFIDIKFPMDLGQRIDNLVRNPDFVHYLAQGDFNGPCRIVSPLKDELQLEIRLMSFGPQQFLLLARDITKIHSIETMRKDFVANVSHELKTPLTVMRGYLEMFQMSVDKLEPSWQHALSTMEGQVTRMDNLVEDLLLLSRVESSNLNEHKKRIRIPRLIKNLIADAQWLNEKKQHQLVISIDNDLMVFGIESEIKSAFANLIANAINYTPPHGKIEICWQKVEGIPLFSVQDTGLGIRAEHVNRLTERFYRVDVSRSRDTGGSGLGLAIVKHVIQRHQAKLVIKSEWKKGSTFSIVFVQDTCDRVPVMS